MRKKRIYSKIIAATLAAAMMVTGLNSTGMWGMEVQATSSDGRTAIEAFKNPLGDEKPMARMWFPDAYAGIDDNDTIAKQIQELANAGFGGVEVTMLADGSSFNNTDAAKIGWGTEAWQALLKKVLKAANTIEGGFTVDITLTAHWPLTINTIDPNDVEASKQMVSTSQVIGEEDIKAGKVTLALPQTKYFDHINGPFIFTSTLVSTSLVKVKSTDESGNKVLEYDSIKELIDKTEQIKPTPAGIPDENALETIEAYKDLELADVEAMFGAPASTDTVEKIDKNGNRKRMADTQYQYEIDISNEDLTEGTYVLINTYQRGTGQVFSDGGFGGYSVSMVNRCYVPDYFSRAGMDEIFEYWNLNILDDELEGLLKANGGSIFEDSIELSAGGSMFEEGEFTESSGSFWTEEIMNKLVEIKGGSYQYEEQFPTVIAVSNNSTLSFDDNISLLDAMKEDYNTVLGTLYLEEHSIPIGEFAREFGYVFRAQAFGLTGVDVAGAAATLDIPEGDNSSKGDGLRYLSSAVNMMAKNYFTMEAVTGMGNNALNWEDMLTEVSQNYSDGVNRVILHGTPYSKTFNGYNSEWPGWLAFGNCFSDSYSYRQAYWEDAQGLTTLMAKTQAILQNAKAQIDVAILKDKSASFSLSSGNSFQTLLDNGYSYNIMSETLLELEGAAVKDGILNAEGAAYKALILNSVSSISKSAMEKLCEYADAGLPIYLYNCNVSKIYGTDSSDNSVQGMMDAFNTLKSKNNVYQVTSQDMLLNNMKENQIIPESSYSQSQIETTHYMDTVDGTEYYYVFYNTKPTNSGMIMQGDGRKFKTDETVTTKMTLKGSGVPYLLDPATGDIQPIAAYTVNPDGTITTSVTLSGGESVIVAIAEDNNRAFPDAPSLHAEYTEGGIVTFTEDGYLNFTSNEAGIYQVTLSNGESKSVKVGQSLDNYTIGTDGWHMSFTSFGPDRSDENKTNVASVPFEISSKVYEDKLFKDPSATIKTTVEFDKITLGDIGNIVASNAQLEELGVDSMKNVSGIAVYSKTVTLPETWDSTTGAVLKMGYYRDQITGITVNGNKIDIINNITDSIDIGKYLKAGQANTIEVKLTTNLINRTIYENSWTGTDTVYTQNGNATGDGANPAQLGRSSRNENGLTSVALLPYTTVSVTRNPSVVEAEKAQEAAEKAQAEAEKAQAAAEKAQAEAEKARAEAEKAQAQAASDKKAAEAAKAEAKAAQTKAETAQAAAKAAQVKAEKAAKAAQIALKKLEAQSKTVTLSRVTSSKKKQMKVVWRKISGISGYQVQYATNKNFSGRKAKTITKASSTGTTIKSLKSGKKYYVRVRSYKTIDGKKIYGAYSNVKSIKVK